MTATPPEQSCSIWHRRTSCVYSCLSLRSMPTRCATAATWPSPQTLFPMQKFTGTIVRNSDAIDISSRTLNVEVDVVNTDHKLLPGQYAFIHLPIPPSTSSMTLPSNALLFRGEGLRVGVVRDGHVQLVPVEIGHDYGAKVEITSGLAPHDQVILNPSDSLAEESASRSRRAKRNEKGILVR